ncbi:MAG: tRNA 2-thiocytidine biosynthesis protein TtcA [Oscillospiraceae bacterium]|nr:tRNA 2-thiocytidine biosynthesis protein TtcA [Oscillospiraceae bacterium]
MNAMKELTRAEEIERSIYKKYQKTIWNKFIKGIKEYKMIEEGDKIAVCISGGKDSMLMAKCMKRLQRYSDVPFDILFLVMDPGYSEVNRQRIMENAATLELPLEIFDARIFNYVVGVENNPCYLCARMRRGHLYNRAKELGCNKIALGHHYDDVIETILMGMLYGSQVQTMMPKLYSKNFEGMELIRPLYLVREEEIISWAKHNDLHFLQCACRFTERNAHQDGTGESKRLEIKHLIRELKKTNPAVESNIFRSVENVNLDTIISYHKGDDYHHFLDEYHEEHGTTRKGTPEDKKRNI